MGSTFKHGQPLLTMNNDDRNLLIVYIMIILLMLTGVI